MPAKKITRKKKRAPRKAKRKMMSVTVRRSIPTAADIITWNETQVTHGVDQNGQQQRLAEPVREIRVTVRWVNEKGDPAPLFSYHDLSIRLIEPCKGRPFTNSEKADILRRAFLDNEDGIGWSEA